MVPGHHHLTRLHFHLRRKDKENLKEMSFVIFHSDGKSSHSQWQWYQTGNSFKATAFEKNICHDEF